MPAPVLNNYLRLLQGVEDLSFQQFIPELGVEALAIAVFPWTAGLDVSRLGPHSCNPFPDCFSHEFAAVI